MEPRELSARLRPMPAEIETHRGTSPGGPCFDSPHKSGDAPTPSFTFSAMVKHSSVTDSGTSLSSARTSPCGASRRTVLGAGLGIAAVAQGAAYALQGPFQAGGPILRDELVMLLHHATQGITTTELTRARGLGYDAWLTEQLNPSAIADTECDALLAGLPGLAMTGQELWSTYGPPNNNTPQLLRELKTGALVRSIYSKRQLFERMVEFWTDHFNVYQNEDQVQRMLKVVDDREVIRANALGTFRDLLMASARSSAMSYYLDNYASTGNNINENYSRELMELHTLGVDGPYTEVDIVEVARCLTGWTFRQPQSGNFGNFVFFQNSHDNGAKTVLGQSIPAGGGINDGIAVIDMLASHPSTAEFISRKMISWLLRSDPEQSMVDHIKAIFLATGGDIKAMVEEILQPETLLEANPWRNPKLKRPFHLMVGLMRQTGAAFQFPQGLIDGLQIMGHGPYDWHAPDGYSDKIGAWGGGVLSRWTLASAMLLNQVPGVIVTHSHISTMIGGVPRSRVALALDQLLCGGQMSQRDRSLLQDYVDTLPQWGLGPAREVIALAASTPSYQTY